MKKSLERKRNLRRTLQTSLVLHYHRMKNLSGEHSMPREKALISRLSHTLCRSDDRVQELGVIAEWVFFFFNLNVFFLYVSEFSSIIGCELTASSCIHQCWWKSVEASPPPLPKKKN